jgi:hypothetical protein
MTESEKCGKDICKKMTKGESKYQRKKGRDLVRNILENIFQIHHISPSLPIIFYTAIDLP